MKDSDCYEAERRASNLHQLSILSTELCRFLELPINPAEMAVDMEKAFEESLVKHGIVPEKDK
ncbi:MAG: hypothetical protein C0602_11535 [Denitrovibrio sp.]|nr:MAG: hypothetical protein C0602_11535 [Denitrovibrio sp.]